MAAPADLTKFQSPINRWRTIGLIVAFVFSLGCVWLLFSSLPTLSSDELERVRWPRTVADLRVLHDVLDGYKAEHYNSWTVMHRVVSCISSLQAFAIPGPLVLSLLAGALFGPAIGLLVVSMSATLGASVCFLLSGLLGRNLVRRHFSSFLKQFQVKLDHHRHNLFFYLLFLRLTPILPNLSINVASPLLGVPLWQFFWATFFGLVPANYLHVTTGQKLGELQSFHQALNWKTLGSLMVLGFLSLVPTLFRKRLEEFDKRLENSVEGKPLNATEKHGHND